jgi:hypothetical protein
MPDIIHWLASAGSTGFVSMSNMKYDALVKGGVEIGERVPIPDGLVPDDAMSRWRPRRPPGYFTPDKPPSAATSQGGRPRPQGILRSSEVGADLKTSDAQAARSLLSSAAVRERAHEMLALALAGPAEWRLDLVRHGRGADLTAETVRRTIRPQRAVPRALAAFQRDGRDLWAEADKPSDPTELGARRSTW